MSNYSNILLSHGDETEATDYPIWAIVKKAGFGQHAWLSGPWFNREDAVRHLNAKRHRYGDKAFVYCFSAHESWHMRELYALARGEDDGRTCVRAQSHSGPIVFGPSGLNCDANWHLAAAAPDMYKAGIALRRAQKAYMDDRGNEALGKAVAEAAVRLDAALAKAEGRVPDAETPSRTSATGLAGEDYREGQS